MLHRCRKVVTILVKSVDGYWMAGQSEVLLGLSWHANCFHSYVMPTQKEDETRPEIVGWNMKTMIGNQCVKVSGLLKV